MSLRPCSQSHLTTDPPLYGGCGLDGRAVFSNPSQVTTLPYQEGASCPYASRLDHPRLQHKSIIREQQGFVNR